jgi:hypothetical protein
LPRGFLPIVDIAKVEHVTLDDLVARAALVLDEAPVTVDLPVFLPSFAAQKHLGRRPYGKVAQRNRLGRHYRHFTPLLAEPRWMNQALARRKVFPVSRIREVGLTLPKPRCSFN